MGFAVKRVPGDKVIASGTLLSVGLGMLAYACAAQSVKRQTKVIRVRRDIDAPPEWDFMLLIG